MHRFELAAQQMWPHRSLSAAFQFLDGQAEKETEPGFAGAKF